MNVLTEVSDETETLVAELTFGENPMYPFCKQKCSEEANISSNDGLTVTVSTVLHTRTGRNLLN